MTTLAINSLLADVLAAHGGLPRWRTFSGLTSTIVTGGRLWELKGVELPPVARFVSTELRHQWMSVTPFGNPDWTMTWVPERVVIHDSSHRVVAERDNPRTAFAKHKFETPWDPLHLAYFNGYAMWTYHALPFVLADPGYVINDIPPIRQDGRILRGLQVQFPAAVHTHTRVQRLYFGEDLLLCRQDYEVDVWANTAAAHMVTDYIQVQGLSLPTKRRVHPRSSDGSIQPEVEFVTIDLSNYIFR